MARRIVERVFDKNKPLIARREFTANGRTYSVGDKFAWKDKSIDVRRVATLFSAGTIDHVAEEAVAPAAVVVPAKPAAPAKPAGPAGPAKTVEAKVK